MQNLKRTLALVLAVIMLVGVMAIGAGAAFKDDADINYDEAVAVMTLAGVINGYPDGTFMPKNTLNRAEAAKMTSCLLGFNDPKGNCTFTDVKGVAEWAWAEGYIAMCESEGIVAGNGDGNFAPADSLIGYAFAKMLLCATGYNAVAEGMTGENWESGVYKLVKATKLDKGIDSFNGDANITREEACQLLFNASQLATRTWIKGTSISGTGLTVDVGGSYSTTNGPTLLASLGITINPEDTSDFGAPATSYTKKNTTITVAKDPIATYTAKISSATTVANKLKGYKIEDAADNIIASDVAVDGATTIGDLTIADETTLAAAIKGEAANGKLIEIYADADTKLIIDVVIVEYTTGKVSSVVTNKTTGDVTYTVGGRTGVDYADEDKDDTVAFISAPAKNDVVTYVVANGVLYIYPTTSFKGAQTSITSAGVATIAGGKYEAGEYEDGTVALVNGSAELTYYVDQYGFIVSQKGSNASTDYAYIVGTYGTSKGGLDATNFTVQVRAVLADGTVGEYDVALSGTTTKKIKNVDDTELTAENVSARAALLGGNLYGYTIADGVITLEGLEAADGTMLKGSVYAGEITADVAKSARNVSGDNGETVLFDANTVIVAYNTTTKKAVTYKGTAALPTGGITESLVYVGTAPAAGANVTASVVFVTAVVESDASKAYAYIDTTKFTEAGTGSNKTWTYSGLLPDGSKIDLVAKTQLSTGTGTKGLYNYAADNTVKDAYPVTPTGSNGYKAGEIALAGSNIMVGDTWYYLSADVQTVFIAKDVYEVEDGQTVIAVLDKTTSAATTVVALYVTVAAEQPNL